MSDFSWLVYDNQATPVLRGEISRQITEARWENVSPGGCGDCTFKFHRPVSFTPNELSPLGFNYDLRINDGERTFWRGRIEKVRAHRGPSGQYYNVTARGYGVALSDKIDATRNVSNKLASTIVSEAITNLGQQIDGTSITATNYTLSAATAINLEFMNANQQIFWASKISNTGFDQQLFSVYPNINGDRIAFFRARPTVPDLEANFSDFIDLESGFDGEFAANRVDLSYISGSSVQVNSTALQGAGPSGWGIIKSLPQFMQELTQSVDGTQAANTALAISSILKLVASSLRCQSNTVFRDSNGQRVPLHRIRAGQLLKLNGIITSIGSGTNLTFSNSALIIKTTYDEDAQSLTIVPESFENRLESLLGGSKQALAGRHSVRS
jgi:hypothetical protein